MMATLYSLSCLISLNIQKNYHRFFTFYFEKLKFCFFPKKNNFFTEKILLPFEKKKLKKTKICSFLRQQNFSVHKNIQKSYHRK